MHNVSFIIIKLSPITIDYNSFVTACNHLHHFHHHHHQQLKAKRMLLFIGENLGDEHKSFIHSHSQGGRRGCHYGHADSFHNGDDDALTMTMVVMKMMVIMNMAVMI